MGAPKAELVGRRYIRDHIEHFLGARPEESFVVSVMNYLDRNIGEYYNDAEKDLYGIRQRLWRRDEIDVLVRDYVKRRKDGYFARAQERTEKERILDRTHTE